MGAFCQLHFVVFAAEPPGVIDKNGAIKYILADLFGAAESQAHFQLARQFAKTTNDWPTHGNGYIVHVFGRYFSGDDRFDHIPFQDSFRAQRQLRTAFGGLAEHVF